MYRCTISLAVIPESDTGSLTNPAMKCASQLETLGRGWRFKSGAEMVPQVDHTHIKLPGESLCWDSDCPPVTSSGDYVGIPTKFTLASKVVVMYTFFFCQLWKTELEAVYFPTLPILQYMRQNPLGRSNSTLLHLVICSSRHNHCSHFALC